MIFDDGVSGTAGRVQGWWERPGIAGRGRRRRGGVRGGGERSGAAGRGS